MQSILPNQIGITPDERNNQLLRLKQTLTSNENLVRVVRRTDLNSLVASERDLAGRRRRAAPAHHHHRPARRRARDQGDLEHFRLLQRPERAHRRRHRPGPDRPVRRAEPLRRPPRDRPVAAASSTRSCAAARSRCSEAEQRRRRVRAALHGRAARRRLDRRPHVGRPGRARQSRAADRRRQRRAQLDARPARRHPADACPASATAAAPPAARSPSSRARSTRTSPAAGPNPIPTSSTPAQQIARLRPYAAGRAAQRQYRRHAQSELRLAARDDGRARGRSSPPPPRAATSSSRTSPSSPRASRPSPASPPSRPG